MPSFIVAVAQVAPVFLDRDATVRKACDMIADAAANGAQLVLFPEAFVPGYPVWVWSVPPGETRTLRTLYAELLENSVSIPGEATRELADAARKAGIAVAIGVNERNIEASGTTLYNTLLYIDAAGEVIAKHRKLIPTGGERLVWGQGDGSTFGIIELPFARVGGLICWENYMPLARYALYAWGMQLLLAPTWDRGEPWLSTLRHVAKEGRVFVLGCCSALRKDDIPDRLPFKERYLSAADEWINVGDSAIVDPDGKFVAGPVRMKEEILYAEIDPAQLTGPRWQLDVAGHYARSDIFRLTVMREERPVVSESSSLSDGT